MRIAYCALRAANEPSALEARTTLLGGMVLWDVAPCGTTGAEPPSEEGFAAERLSGLHPMESPAKRAAGSPARQAQSIDSKLSNARAAVSRSVGERLSRLVAGHSWGKVGDFDVLTHRGMEPR